LTVSEFAEIGFLVGELLSGFNSCFFFIGDFVLIFSPIPELIPEFYYYQLPNGLRYLRWGGDGGAVQLEK
jgi:hypothetical protein